MKLGSLFDGSGGFPLAGLINGIEAVWASEIEPFPIRVTTKRIPQMKHYGDISMLNGAELPPVDIITFGSPCQDLSVAGQRAGLHDGKRSNLFFEAIRIIKEMREATNGKYPRYIVWENVPGAFSSNKGEDFRCVLESICRIKDETLSVPKADKWRNAGSIVGEHFSLAWRVLDAQYWGVPQRRRRIFLVADFAGGSAGEILFEPEGVSRNFTPSGIPWQRTAGNVEAGTGASGFDGYNGQLTGDVSSTLGVNCGMSTGRNGVVLNDQGESVMSVTEDMTATLRAEEHGHQPSCNNDQTVFVPTAYGICSDKSNSMLSDNPHSGIYKAETSRTIDANGGNPGCNQGGIAVVALQGSMIGRSDKNGPQGSGVNEDVSFTLDATDRHAMAYCNQSVVNETEPCYIVRRLTPTECARLQGFPDWWCDDLGTENPTEDEILFWTEVWETYRKIMGKSSKPKTRKQIIKWLNNPHSDSAEYKMWGNGVALPCVCFVLAGIVLSAENTAE